MGALSPPDTGVHRRLFPITIPWLDLAHARPSRRDDSIKPASFDSPACSLVLDMSAPYALMEVEFSTDALRPDADAAVLAL